MCALAEVGRCTSWSASGGPSYATRPSRITTARSIGEPSGRARGRPARSSHRGRKSRCVSASACWFGRSTPAARSSRKNRSGPPARARAISARCCCPPDGGTRRRRRRPARASDPDGRRRSPAGRRSEGGRSSRRRVSRPYSRRSTLTEAGTPEPAPLRWGTKPDALPVAEAGSNGVPNRVSSPWASGRRPVSARTRVDLPEPLAPSRATKSAGLHAQVDAAQDRSAGHRDRGRRRGRPVVSISAPSAPAGPRGWRASMKGSPGRPSRRGDLLFGLSTAVRTPMSSARVSVSRWACELVPPKTVVMPSSSYEVVAVVGEDDGEGLGIGVEAGDRADTSSPYLPR